MTQPKTNNSFSYNPSDRQEERFQMVREQIEGRGVGYYKVLNAMRHIPRHLFVAQEYSDQAYNDAALPLGQGLTISQPYIVALMTALARPEQGDSVLEIGTGSGYQSALLAEMGCQVYSIDIVADMLEQAHQHITQIGKEENIHLKQGDGFYGWPEAGPFDSIIITCAVRAIPEPLIIQLKPGGKIIAPVGNTLMQQTLTIFTLSSSDKLTADPITTVAFIPMTGEHGF